MNTKKILYATTAIVGASVASTGAQAQQGIDLGMSGFFNYFTGVTDGSFGGEDVKTFQDATITFSGSTTFDNGIEAGVNIEVEGSQFGADGGDADLSFAGGADEQYGYLKGSFGTLQFGAQNSAGYQMSWTTGPMWWQKLMPINSGWQNAFIDSDSAQFNNFYAPGGSTHLDLHDEAQTVAYFTPRVQGFKFGASWSPESGTTDRGGVGVTESSADFTSEGGAQAIDDAYSLSANYSTSVRNADVALFGAFQQGDVESNSNGFITGNIGGDDTVEQYMTGFRVSSMGFSLGYQFGAQESDPVAGAGESQDGWTHGADIRYQTGPWHAQLEGMISEIQGNPGNGEDEEQTTVKGAVAYNLGPGVALSGSVVFDDVDEDGAGVGHDEVAGIIGTSFSF